VGAARLNDDPWDLEEAEHEGRRDDDRFEDDDEARARREARQAKREAGEANRARLRAEAQAAIRRAGPGATSSPDADRGARLARTRPGLGPRKLPDPKRHLIDLLGQAAGTRAWRDLNEAADHVDAGRVGESKPIANRLYKLVPEVVEVAEIWGLTLYGLGQWHDAIEVLEEVRHLSGLPDQNPVLADAHRAVGNYADVDALWRELSEASPASELVTEGRIVAAGALADQGEMASAVRLLSKGWKRPKRPMEHHLRRAYALADLYERAGEAPRAKELFGWIAHHEPKWGDAKHRSQ